MEKGGEVSGRSERLTRPWWLHRKAVLEQTSLPGLVRLPVSLTRDDTGTRRDDTATRGAQETRGAQPFCGAGLPLPLGSSYASRMLKMCAGKGMGRRKPEPGARCWQRSLLPPPFPARAGAYCCCHQCQLVRASSCAKITYRCTARCPTLGLSNGRIGPYEPCA